MLMSNFTLFFYLKPLKKLKRSIFLTLLVVLCSGMTWAQSLDPSATEANTYLINTADDWAKFVNDVKNGCSYSGKFVKLMTDIFITSMDQTVGVYAANAADRKPFSGTFDGNTHTINVNLTTTSTYTAPFVCVKRAIIRNLTITGNINSSVGYAAGVVGCSYDYPDNSEESRINAGVYVSVNITDGNTENPGSAGNYCAGIAVDASYLQVSTCIYNGKIIAGSNSAGFCAIGDDSNGYNTKVNNCFFDPASGSSITGSNIQNFIANGKSKYFDKNYYTCQIGTSTQGTLAFKTYEAASASPSYFTQKTTVPTQSTVHYDVYAVGTGSVTLNGTSFFRSFVAGGGLSYDVTYNGTEVPSGNYTTKIKDKNGNEVADIAAIGTGTYTFEITGRHNNAGKVSTTFKVYANSGTGTEDDPYQIGTYNDWKYFAEIVNNGYSFEGEFLKLTDSIAVDKLVGTSTTKPFQGTFDGGWKSLTFNIGTSEKPITYQYCAPFKYIKGATIKNMTVYGTIYTKKKNAAGFVGIALGDDSYKNNIINCTSSITIDCTANDVADGSYKNGTHGGFVGEQSATSTDVNGTINFENCLFDGSIIDNKDTKTVGKCAGFVGWGGKNLYINYTNCYNAGTISIANNISHFHRNHETKGSWTNQIYYIKDQQSDVKPGPKGDRASSTCSGISKKYTEGGNDYYIPVIISNIHTTYSYTGSDFTIEPLVTYYGKKLIENTHYTMSLKKLVGESYVEVPDNIITSAGTYELTMAAKSNKGYTGSKVYVITVVGVNSWAELAAAILPSDTDIEIDLTSDIVATNTDGALIINGGNVTINLNNHKIDRNLAGSTAVTTGQVIRVLSGSLTINGPGTIRGGNSQAENDGKEQDDKNDCGGIYNMGTLVLNDVTVSYNRCIKYTDSPTNDAATARGGGIYTGEGSSFTMHGGSIVHNEAKGGGGGVYCYRPALFSMKDVLISDNDSESKGGGLRIRTTSTVTALLTNCTISSNRATETDPTRSSDGGGVYMQEGKLKMVECTIGGAEGEGNQSAFAGAGFFQNGGYTQAVDCNISYNSAYTTDDRMYGGGICIKAGTYLMDSGTITNNHSYRDGGGVYIYHGAHFQIKGHDIQINDNLRTRPGAVPEDTENNAYTDDDAYIEIVGPITGESKIHITGHGYGGIYTKDKDKWQVPDSIIVPDGKYQLVTVDEQGQPLKEVFLAPYYWFDEGSWEGHFVPEPTSKIVVNKAVELHTGDIGYTDSIRYVNGSIILKDGAQLVCLGGLVKHSPPAEALIEKKIKAFEDAKGGWYAISIPTDGVKIWDLWEHHTNLVQKDKNEDLDSNMDLLRFDEPHGFWDSYSDISAIQNSYFGPFTHTENGRGYLYRYREDRNLSFYGFINLGDVTYRVHADNSGNAKLQGWNIIGNPYTHNVFKGDGQAIPNGELLDDHFYMLKKNGSWYPQKDNQDTIKVCQGILVHATKTDNLVMHDVSITPPPSASEPGEQRGGEKNVENSIKFTVTNSTYEDVAYALFDKGTGLMKVDHINEDIQVIYIRHNDADYAIASLEDNTRSFDLGFGAKTLSSYTLTVDIEGEFNYLHLIDKLTGQDIDLLVENKYQFIGSSADRKDRFIVRLNNASDTGIDEFAYQSGNDIIVCGYGELQMFDAAGRLISTQYVNGVESVNKPSQSGVYIMRLLGTDVKTQKIVVR